MAKKKQLRVELRYYEIPRGECVLPLLGEHWRRNYGNDLDSLHFHNLMEVGFCHDGDGVIQTSGGDIPYHQGTFTMVPRYIPHSTRTRTLDSTDYWEYLFFDAQQILADHCKDNPLLERQLLARLNPNLYIGDATQHPEAASLISAVLDRARSASEEFRTKVQDSLLFALLLEFGGMVSSGKEYPSSPVGTGVISNALRYVEEHYAESMRISDLAGACGLSETHFRRLFDDAVSMQPAEYINLTRIQKACELLCAGDDSMEVVAQKTGFSSQSSFSRNFVKLLGVPPYRWKNSDEQYFGPRQFKITAREGWL
jgi:AraC-like DNA-binding protein